MMEKLSTKSSILHLFLMLDFSMLLKIQKNYKFCFICCNKLDYIGVLLGEEITADALVQALILAKDMHLQLATGKRMPNIPVLNQIADFRPREVQQRANAESPHERRRDNLADVGTSRFHKMTDMVRQPRSDSIDNIDDPDREEVKERRSRSNKEKATFNNIASSAPLTLKEQQRFEYEEAQILDLQKLEEIREKENQERIKQIKQRIEQEEIQIKVAESKSKLNDEPEASNKDAAIIQIRLADGSKSVTRRFLKTSKIEELYLYIRSLGDEAGFEDQNCEFELFQQNTMIGSSNPELKCKIFNNMEATIEEEKLYPRAKIYCREL